MTPKVKIFENLFPDSSTGHRTIRFVAKFDENRPLRSCCKVVWITTQKKMGSAGLVPAPILPQIGRSPPKFRERCSPLTCPRIPNLVRIGYALPNLFRKDWFFSRKSKYNIYIYRLSAYNEYSIGSQNAMSITCASRLTRSRCVRYPWIFQIVSVAITNVTDALRPVYSHTTQLNWPTWTAYSQVSRVFVYDVTTYKLSQLGHYVHW